MIRSCLSAALLMLAACPASAAPAESRYSSLANGDCVFAAVAEDDVGEDQSKTCPGLGGIDVVVESYGTRVRIGFDWPAAPGVNAVPTVVAAWSAGMKVEWRGRTGAAGFTPYAATIRMLYPRDDGPDVGEQLLAVMRIGAGEACLMAVIDLRADSDAYVRARNIADTAPAFTCGRDKPRIAGAQTPSALRLLAETAS